MLLSAELFIELYKQRKKSGSKEVTRKTLSDYNLSKDQLNNYFDFVDDLDLNEDGIKIMIDEINSGHMNL
jgi:hypothetical protein